jgi:hypothetical protein
MMDKKQLRSLIEQTLKEIGKTKPGLFNSYAIDLLMGTSAQESHLGTYIRQLGNGPALGIFQMEPSTFEDIMDNFLYYQPDLIRAIKQICNVERLTPTTLMYNLKVAIIFARLHYWRVSDPLPTTINGMALYWKEYYNTRLGKGKPEEFIENYKRFVL